MNMDIETSIRNFILNEPTISSASIDIDDALFESGLLDSLNFLQLVEYIENQFGIIVEDSDMVNENFDSIRNIVTYLAKKGVQ